MNEEVIEKPKRKMTQAEKWLNRKPPRPGFRGFNKKKPSLPKKLKDIYDPYS